MKNTTDRELFMHLFFISGVQGDTCQLPGEESWHCIKVLRLSPGDTVHLTDGKGNLYEGRLTNADQRGARVEILETKPALSNHRLKLHIAIAPPKNIDRFEWFLEKATEIGIDEITPLICEHSERDSVKPSRLEKVIVSAMKQSLKTWLPILHEPIPLKSFIRQETHDQKFIAWCDTGTEQELFAAYHKGSDATVLIGPEGDFSSLEVELAMAAGFQPVSLGKSRLRTETAGIVACHTIGLLNRMK